MRFLGIRGFAGKGFGRLCRSDRNSRLSCCAGSRLASLVGLRLRRAARRLERLGGACGLCGMVLAVLSSHR